MFSLGAENETRTRDPDLGKVVLYQLSYFRIAVVWDCKYRQDFSKCKLFFEKILDIALEFLEETEVVLKVIAQVLHLPFEHGNPLDTHSEGKSAVLAAVYA